MSNTTTNQRGTESELAGLHGLLAKYFEQALLTAKNTGEPVPPATLNAIRQFLKDNGIDCVGRENPDINNIVESLPTFADSGEGDEGDRLLN